MWHPHATTDSVTAVRNVQYLLLTIPAAAIGALTAAHGRHALWAIERRLHAFGQRRR